MKEHANNTLYQSETEWLDTNLFEVDSVAIENNTIRYAVTNSSASSDLLIAMVGGIPRSPERQINLPLINKLYGRIAVQALAQNTTSLMYSHPGTGGSKGSLSKDTTQDRIETLAEIVSNVASKKGIDKISLVGMSAGSYIAARAINRLMLNDLTVESVILQSPAAYPEDIEGIPYGEGFTKIIRSNWEINKSPLLKDLHEIAKNDIGILISYFQIDNPPIPEKIKNAIYNKAHELMSSGYNINTYTIYGVEHNFRKIGYEEGQNIVNNNSIRAVADNLIKYIHAQHNQT